MYEVVRVGSLEVKVRTTDVTTHAVFSEHPEKWAYLRMQLIAALQLLDGEVKDLK